MRQKIKNEIKNLAPVTYIVRLNGPLAVQLSMRAIAEGRTPEQVISDAVAAHSSSRKLNAIRRGVR